MESGLTGNPSRKAMAVALMSADLSDSPPACVWVGLANALLPGAGWLMVDRPGLAVLLGLGFWMPLTVAAYGAWIAPAVISGRMALAWAALAAALYLLGQVRLWRVLQGQGRRQAEYQARVGPLMRAVYEAMSLGRWLDAQLELDRLLAAAPEHFEGNLTQARLLAILGKSDQADRAYGRCRRLDRSGRWAWEIGRETAVLRS